MVAISIASLIYKSTRYADWVCESIQEFTPQLSRGEAEFFFVANDPTEGLLEHLRRKGYKHYVNRNPRRTEQELLALGYGTPEYMHRVYRGYNKAIQLAEGEIVVLINSDCYVSPDWLENLLKYVSSETIVCSKLVECMHTKYGHVFPGAYHGEFGSHPDTFSKDAFLGFCEQVRTTGLQLGGAYMPCAFHKHVAARVGLYPEGNLASTSFNHVVATGDEVFFRKLGRAGIRHVTAMDSIVYHTKEGEKDELLRPASAGMCRGVVASNVERGLCRPHKVLAVTLRNDGEQQYLAIPRIHEYPASLSRLIRRHRDIVFLRTVGAAKALLPARLFGVLRTVWYSLARKRQ